MFTWLRSESKTDSDDSHRSNGSEALTRDSPSSMLPSSCAANAPQDRNDAKERAKVKRPRSQRSLRGSVALKVPLAGI